MPNDFPYVTKPIDEWNPTQNTKLVFGFGPSKLIDISLILTRSPLVLVVSSCVARG